MIFMDSSASQMKLLTLSTGTGNLYYLKILKLKLSARSVKGISLNPILNSFQLTVNRYKIDQELIKAFFRSMEMDLHYGNYDDKTYAEYIYGSAEVVGLMCLYVFCEGNKKQYDLLEPAARSLGAAFQKVNFLRDINADFNILSRTYFPGVDFNNFTPEMKEKIETDIALDFDKAYKGIIALPWKASLVYMLHINTIFHCIKKSQKVGASHILERRIRIPDYQKALILARAGVKNQLNLIRQ